MIFVDKQIHIQYSLRRRNIELPLSCLIKRRSMLPSLGKMPSGEEKQKVQQSPNYRNGQFQNPVPTTTLTKGSNILKMLVRFINKPSDCYPPKPLPSVNTNLLALPDDKPVIVWFGHSSYLIKMNGKIILVDPVFSGYVSPFKGMNKAFAGTNMFGVDDMPGIDILIITHDHYDHLDYETIIRLKSKVNAVCTSLGVASHLVYWGYNEAIIHELDWHQSVDINGIKLTALPARHFSGRTVKRDQTLWSAFVLQTKEYKLFLGGDSGYASHFKEIGEKQGPFDVALLECGQYNLAWHDIHMLPEEVVQAATDLNAKLVLPVHWGKFSISLHPWNEPIQRVTAKANELHVKLATPMIGEVVIIGEPYPDTRWWEEVKI